MNGYGKRVLFVLIGAVVLFMANTALNSFVKKDEVAALASKDEIHQIAVDMAVMKEHMKSLDEKMPLVVSNQVKNVEQDQRIANIEEYITDRWKMDLSIPGIKGQKRQ